MLDPAAQVRQSGSSRLRKSLYKSACDLSSPDIAVKSICVSEVNPDLGPSGPIPQHLSRQIIAESGNEDRNHLRRGVLDQFPDAWLRGQKRIRIGALVTRAFRMKTNDVARAAVCRVQSAVETKTCQKRASRESDFRQTRRMADTSTTIP